MRSFKKLQQYPDFLISVLKMIAHHWPWSAESVVKYSVSSRSITGSLSEMLTLSRPHFLTKNEGKKQCVQTLVVPGAAPACLPCQLLDLNGPHISHLHVSAFLLSCLPQLYPPVSRV